MGTSKGAEERAHWYLLEPIIVVGLTLELLGVTMGFSIISWMLFNEFCSWMGMTFAWMLNMVEPGGWAVFYAFFASSQGPHHK